MSNLYRAFILVIMLIGTGVLIAGDEDRWNFQTVKAKTAAVRYEQTVREADATHQRAITDAQRQFVADLDAAKVDATKAGNLDEAVRLREAIQAVSKTMPTVKIDNPFYSVVGKWDFTWGTMGFGSPFAVSEEGQLVFSSSDKRQLTIHEERILSIGKGVNNVELIPVNGRLIVLGWTRGKRDPLKDQPNHVGIATRID